MPCKVGRFVFDDEGNSVGIQQVRVHEKYVCSHCGKRVVVKMSTKNNLFFAHERQQYQKQSHDFSEHQIVQESFKQLFTKLQIPCRLECSMADGLRADVLFCLQRGLIKYYYVLEIQRTAISDAEIRRRIRGYQKRQIGLIWIVPRKLQAEITLRRWEQYLLVQQQQVLFYDVSRQNYYLVNDYLKLSTKRVRIAYQKYDIYRLCSLALNGGQLKQMPNRLLSDRFFRTALSTWQQQWARSYLHKRTDILQQLLYQFKLDIRTFCLSCYTPTVKFLNGRQAVFWMQSVIYLLVIKKCWLVGNVIHFFVQRELLIDKTKTSDIIKYVQYIKKEEQHSSF